MLWCCGRLGCGCLDVLEVVVDVVLNDDDAVVVGADADVADAVVVMDCSC